MSLATDDLYRIWSVALVLLLFVSLQDDPGNVLIILNAAVARRNRLTQKRLTTHGTVFWNTTVTQGFVLQTSRSRSSAAQLQNGRLRQPNMRSLKLERTITMEESVGTVQ